MSSTDYYYYYEEDIVPMTPEVQIPSGIGLTILIVIAIGGNLMTVVAYLRDRRLNTVYDFYIFNLGITDLLLSCISMPFYAVYTLMEFTWPFGYAFCKVWLIMDFTMCFQSIMIMLILSLDRLFMITMGPVYMHKITKTVGFIQISISWVVSFLVYGPAIIGWNHWVGYSTVEEDDCDVEFAYDHAFTTATALVEFILPFICLTSLNAMVYYKIRQRMVKISPVATTTNIQIIRVSSKQPEDSDNDNNFDDNDKETENIKHTTSKAYAIANGNTCTQTKGTSKVTTDTKSSTDKQTKAAKFLAMLVVAFLVFWAPYTVTTMAISFCDECINTSLYEFFNWLLWMKSAVNPFLYAYNSPRYRANFQRFLSCNGTLPIFKTRQNEREIHTTMTST